MTTPTTPPMTEERLTEIGSPGGPGWDGDTVVELLAEVRRLREIGQRGCDCSADVACAFARERDSLAAKLATAVEALRWYALPPEQRPIPDEFEDDDGADRARAALAAVERKEGTDEPY